jgi:hypothetical protein
LACSNIDQKTDPVDRFWNSVGIKVDNGCILWSAGVNEDNYGVFWNGRKLVGAHRVAYELMVGPIPTGLCVLHRCDNPPCINPTHLFLGTNLDNIADKISKGRTVKGEASVHAKLTEAKVLEIRRRRASGESLVSLAKEFGVAYPTICGVVYRKTWKHL